MKPPIFILLASSGIIANPLPIAAQTSTLPPNPSNLPLSKRPIADPVLGQMVTVKHTDSKSDATVDEDLLSLARFADINIIADSTGFVTLKLPDKPLPFPLNDVPQPLMFKLSQISRAHDLSELRLNPRTFLFWTRPDLKTIGRRLSEGEDIPRVTVSGDGGNPFQRANAAPPTSPFSERLNEFLQTVSPANLPTPSGRMVQMVPMRDLPPELRAESIARTQKYLLYEGLTNNWKAWFHDDFWDNATLQLRALPKGPAQPDAPGAQYQVLFLNGTVQEASGRKGISMMSLALRDMPPGATPLLAQPGLPPGFKPIVPPVQNAVP